MDGIEAAARYSYRPNQLRYCGPVQADRSFLEYVRSGKGKGEVKKFLKDFEAVYPYLQLIAKRSSKKPFDPRVVEAYWLGNSLLRKVPPQDLKKHILGLVHQGLVKSLAKRLSENLPAGLLPNHFFHVVYMGCGTLTRSVKNTLVNMENCRINHGKVKKIEMGKLRVRFRPLVRKQRKFFLGLPRTKKVDYHQSFLPRIKLNDFVAIHWNFAVQRLDSAQLEKLKKYTRHNINALNNSV